MKPVEFAAEELHVFSREAPLNLPSDQEFEEMLKLFPVDPKTGMRILIGIVEQYQCEHSTH